MKHAGGMVGVRLAGGCEAEHVFLKPLVEEATQIEACEFAPLVEEAPDTYAFKRNLSFRFKVMIELVQMGPIKSC